FLVERGLDALGELLTHHSLQIARDLVDSGVALFGANDGASGRLRDVGELRLAFGGELRRERLARVVPAEALRFAIRTDLRDGLGGAPPDLNDVDARLLLGSLLRDADGISFQVLPVGDEQNDPHVVLRFRIPSQNLAGSLERAGDRGTTDGHVIGLELPEE